MKRISDLFYLSLVTFQCMTSNLRQHQFLAQATHVFSCFVSARMYRTLLSVFQTYRCLSVGSQNAIHLSKSFFFLSWPRTLNIYLFCRPWHKYVAVGFFCLQIIEVSLLSCKCLYLSRFQTIHRKIRVYKNKSQRKFVRRLNMWLSARGTSRNSNYELQMPNRSSMKI